MKTEEKHVPVLLGEIVDLLHLNKHIEKEKEFKVIDATVGTGGHGVEIVKKGGQLLGIDADTQMLEVARKNLEKACPASQSIEKPFKLVQGNFRNLRQIASRSGFAAVNGIIFDLGISSLHLDTFGRGFSFKDENQILDMRLNPAEQGVMAKDLLNLLRPDQLEELFAAVLDPGESRRLARRVVQARESHPFQTVGDFTKICGSRRGGSRIHPATRPFMALRMAVNSELEALNEALPQALDLLVKGGRLLVISFHSGEDRIVKNLFRDWEKGNQVFLISKEPVRPSADEIAANPRSRSAVLRVVEKK